MTYNKLIPALLILTMLPIASVASDSCIMTLGTVNPGLAAACQSAKSKAEQAAKDSLDWGTGKYGRKEAGQDESDRWSNGKASNEDSTEAAQYNETASGLFSAGSAEAAAKLMIPQSIQLANCAALTAAQGSADRQNAAQNKKNVEMLSQNERDDTNSGTAGVDPNSIIVRDQP
jgi:hypothetical protein